jgi:hypothetical protein
VKAFLDNFTAGLGAATVVLLLMSITHEYGYFWAVGRHFQTFLSTSDYFSNAVLWLPAMVVFYTDSWIGTCSWGRRDMFQLV